MSYKIYTYGDPYRLHQTSFWKAIQAAPHLCSSQVMVNGFRNLFEAQFQSLLCPIDTVLKNVFKDWYGNIERQINQYIAVSRKLQELRHQGLDNKLYNSLKHNQRALLEALRLFVELSIKSNDLDEDAANAEQKVFISLLRDMDNPLSPIHEPFTLNPEMRLSDMVQAFRATIKEELDREEKETRKKSRISHLKKLYKRFSEKDLRQVVIHGLHQFTPLQLRFIQMLHQLGTEVVFLYNYQPQYPEIYATWENLYQLFETEVERDQALGPYKSNAHSHQVAQAFAALLQPEKRKGPRRWKPLSQEVEFLAFDNISEFALFVSQNLQQAELKNPEDPVSVMTERVYSAGREIHDILRLYHPEHAGDRHFLHYPIGQFFWALYWLWDPEKGQIKLDWDAIRECLVAGILKTSEPERLMTVLEAVQPYFKGLGYYDEFTQRINSLKKNYQKLLNKRDELKQHLKRIAFFKPGFIDMEEIQHFEESIRQINEIARYLFQREGKEYISFREHFLRLKDYISQNLVDLAVEEENILVVNLLDRLSQVSHNTNLSSSLEDLRNGLYYYLKQKDQERPEWIVRNFVQIEGDVLLSQGQYDRSIKYEEEVPVYHFACLSDRMMNKKIDELLPWPLTDDFIRKAYSPTSLIFQLYYTSISEYDKFLRYALFYGLCYNKCRMRLSYVVHLEDGVEQPYFPLRMLGIQPQRYSEKRVEPVHSSQKTVLVGELRNFSVDDDELAAFFLCPYRYFLDYVVRGQVVIDNEFILKKYFENLLIFLVWNKLKGKWGNREELEQQVKSSLVEKQRELQEYFPFWRETIDLQDMIISAENYFVHNLIQPYKIQQYKINDYDKTHIRLRLLYQKAKFSSAHPHPMKAFQDKAGGNGNKHTYFLKLTAEEPLTRAVKAYLQSNHGLHTHVGEWCHYCSHKQLCIQCFLVEDQPNDEGEESQAYADRNVRPGSYQNRSR